MRGQESKPAKTAQRSLIRERGAVLVLGCFLIAVLLAGAALAADGFRLVQTHIKLHNGAEYGAEAGLRQFIKDRGNSCSSGTPCSCNDFDCLQQEACSRAEAVADYHLFDQGTASDLCAQENSFLPGIWHENSGIFTASTNSADINAVKIQVQTQAPRFFFARVFGIVEAGINAEVIVWRKDTADGLYNYRLALPGGTHSSSSSSSRESSSSAAAFSSEQDSWWYSSSSSAGSNSSPAPAPIAPSSSSSWSWPPEVEI